MEPRTFLSWSFQLCRCAGLEIRIHWSVLAVALLGCWWMLSHGTPWWLLPVIAVIPPLSLLLHELGHAFMTRLVGGEASLLVLWAFGGLVQSDIPPTPGKRFAVAASGPLVNFLIYACAALVLGAPSVVTADGWLGVAALVLGYLAMVNLALLLFNLLPAYPLDGGAMLRSALWPVVGLQRAVSWTIAIAYVVIGCLAVYAVLTASLFLFAISLWLLVAVIQEHVARHRGFDSYLGLPPEIDPNGRPLIESWLENRRERRRERDEQASAAEQVILDRLLAKVSEHGLPALTDDERTTLQRISKRQRERQSTAS